MKYYIGSILFIISVTFVLATDTVSIPQKENFHLFLLAGQSNMAGRGTITDEEQELHPRILMLAQDGYWKPALHPIHYENKNAGVGLAMSFALKLAQNDSTITIGLVPAACGGSPISSWEPGEYHKQTGSYPYDDAIKRSRRAMKDGLLKGILWHQGESDSNPQDAVHYKSRLETLINRFRADLKVDNVPFIIGQLGQFPEKPWNESRNIVNDAHLSISKEMNFVGFVISDSLTSKPDNTHFETKSLNIFGRRYVDSYYEIVKVTK